METPATSTQHRSGPTRRVAIFSGRVQGVGFRASVRAIAAGHAVTGWVRNEADGSVRVEVQGAAGEVTAFLDAVHQARRSNIHAVCVEEVPAIDAESGFEIRR